MKSWFTVYGSFIIILFIIASWAVLFYFISPTSIVESIGIKNTYLVVFILALVCGFSSVTGATFYIALAALAHGGSNPYILGLVGGIGLCISDFLFYMLVSKGVRIVDVKWKKVSDRVKRWVRWMPEWGVKAFVYLYSAFAPIPNDFLLVTLAITGIPFKRIVLFLFAGDITSTLLLAYLSHL
jgi:Zn-dependent protease with chaperone function